MTFAGRTIAELAALPLTELAEVLRPTAELERPRRGLASATSGERHRGRRDDRRATCARASRCWSSSGSATSASTAPTPTLSPGELQRLRLATQLRSGLFGVVYVLDEPSAGLHPADAEPLLDVLERLRAAGNSLFVVEHDMDVVRRADWVVDVGPGAGEGGGQVLYSGPVDGLADVEASVTRPLPLRAPVPAVTETPAPPHAAGCTLRRQSPATTWVDSTSTSRSACSPPSRACPGPASRRSSPRCSPTSLRRRARRDGRAPRTPTRPSSGRTTRRGVIGRARGSRRSTGSSRSTSGRSAARRARTSRPTPACSTPSARPSRPPTRRGPAATAPGGSRSTSRGGRCETCQGEGFVAVELLFLPGTYAPCPTCHGARYDPETLEVSCRGRNDRRRARPDRRRGGGVPRRRAAGARRSLATLRDVGLGYLRLGQPATELSGGEAQRIKLATELQRAPPRPHPVPARRADDRPAPRRRRAARRAAAPARRRGPHGRRGRARHGRGRERRLGDRPRARRRRAGRARRRRRARPREVAARRASRTAPYLARRLAGMEG